jgi:2',3'-cyclic-nucleotide 2'-phosphodiesterase (5'-nucleotidase family)
MIKRWRQEGRNLLVFDGGDLFYPSLSQPLSEDQKAEMNLKAQAIVAAFNHMGADAITIGDDDLLLGKENLLELLKGAEFRVVSANLMDNESGTPLFRPYYIKEVGGLRVGIFGLFPKLEGETDGRFAGLSVLEPFGVAQQMVSMLLAKNVEGISVIVGGHTGINLSHPRIVRNTVVLQVAKKGRYLGRADLTISDPFQPFVNVRTRETLKRRLERIETRLEALDKESSLDSAGKKRNRKTLEQQKAETEKLLRSYEGHNEMVNQIVPLTDQVLPDADCDRILRSYLGQVAHTKDESNP